MCRRKVIGRELGVGEEEKRRGWEIGRVVRGPESEIRRVGLQYKANRSWRLAGRRNETVGQEHGLDAS